MSEICKMLKNTERTEKQIHRNSKFTQEEKERIARTFRRAFTRRDKPIKLIDISHTLGMFMKALKAENLVQGLYIPLKFHMTDESIQKAVTEFGSTSYEELLPFLKTIKQPSNSTTLALIRDPPVNLLYEYQIQRHNTPKSGLEDSTTTLSNNLDNERSLLKSEWANLHKIGMNLTKIYAEMIEFELNTTKKFSLVDKELKLPNIVLEPNMALIPHSRLTYFENFSNEAGKGIIKKLERKMKKNFLDYNDVSQSLNQDLKSKRGRKKLKKD